MASTDYSEGYAKYLNKGLSMLTKDSSNEDVQLVYNEWASQYEKVSYNALSKI